MKPREGKIFNLKPEMTLAMKLAASFAITYYGLLLIFEIITVVFRRYYFDTYYFNQGKMSLGSQEFIIQIIQLALSITLVFSLIQIFRKKTYGKAIFVIATLVLIFFQIIATGIIPVLKYALELLMLLIIAPIRVKKKVMVKETAKPSESVETEESIPNEAEAPSEPEVPITSETPIESEMPSEPETPIESETSTEQEISSDSNPTENE